MFIYIINFEICNINTLITPLGPAQDYSNPATPLYACEVGYPGGPYHEDTNDMEYELNPDILTDILNFTSVPYAPDQMSNNI